MKTCTKCKKPKPLEAFAPKMMGVGLKSRCIICAHKKYKGVYYSKEEYAVVYAPRVYPTKEESRAKKTARTKMRALRKKKAAPEWLSAEQKQNISIIYQMARKLTDEYGVRLDVDHIEPLQGKDVCGLHVPWNLQLMEHKTNIRKGNRRGRI